MEQEELDALTLDQSRVLYHKVRKTYRRKRASHLAVLTAAVINDLWLHHVFAPLAYQPELSALLRLRMVCRNWCNLVPGVTHLNAVAISPEFVSRPVLTGLTAFTYLTSLSLQVGWIESDISFFARIKHLTLLPVRAHGQALPPSWVTRWSISPVWSGLETLVNSSGCAVDRLTRLTSLRSLVMDHYPFWTGDLLQLTRLQELKIEGVSLERVLDAETGATTFRYAKPKK